MNLDKVPGNINLEYISGFSALIILCLHLAKKHGLLWNVCMFFILYLL